MPLQEELLKKIKCCFHTDGHIAIDHVEVVLVNNVLGNKNFDKAKMLKLEARLNR